MEELTDRQNELLEDSYKENNVFEETGLTLDEWINDLSWERIFKITDTTKDDE